MNKFNILDWLYEYWIPVKGFEDTYEVSNWGRVRSAERDVVYSDGRVYHYESAIKTPTENKKRKGYMQIDLYKNNRRKMCKVHRLVAEAFLPNPDNLEQVNHRDECTSNNAVWNLEWCNCKYNNGYGTKRERLSEIRRKWWINKRNGEETNNGGGDKEE